MQLFLSNASRSESRHCLKQRHRVWDTSNRFRRYRHIFRHRFRFQIQNFRPSASWICPAWATKLGVPSLAFAGLSIPSPSSCGIGPLAFAVYFKGSIFSITMALDPPR
jgi:hypothetical protein